MTKEPIWQSRSGGYTGPFWIGHGMVRDRAGKTH